MPDLSEISRSLRGAAALFLGRKDGLLALDRTVDGFWRSFWVILLLLPLNAITVLAMTRVGRASDTFGALFFAQLPILVLDWIAFPIALAFAAKPMGVSANYVSYVVARNWSAPIAAAILTIPFLLQGAGWVPMNGAALLSLVALVVVLRYHYVVVRLALGAAMPMAIGVVAGDLILTLLIIALFE